MQLLITQLRVTNSRFNRNFLLKEKQKQPKQNKQSTRKQVNSGNFESLPKVTNWVFLFLNSYPMIASWGMTLWFVTDDFKHAINSKKHNYLYRSMYSIRQFYLKSTVQVAQNVD